MFLCLSLCMVLLATYSAAQHQSGVQKSDRDIRGSADGFRLKRSIYTIGSADGFRLKRSIYTIGKLAAQQLLQGAKFLYTNGFDTVFVKKGGFGEALEDFDRVNTAKRINMIPGESEVRFQNVVKRGKVGDTYLLLRKGPSGTGVLQMSRSVGQHKPMLTIDPMLDKIIVYTDF